MKDAQLRSEQLKDSLPTVRETSPYYAEVAVWDSATGVISREQRRLLRYPRVAPNAVGEVWGLYIPETHEFAAYWRAMVCGQPGMLLEPEEVQRLAVLVALGLWPNL